METQVMFPGELWQTAHLYLREDFKLMKGGRTHRFIHVGENITLILHGTSASGVALDKKSTELIRDMEEQWRVIQEYNISDIKPKVEPQIQASRTLSLPAPAAAEHAEAKSTAGQGSS